MPFLYYNLPLHRQGFRPYGTTNTWAATQLSGMPRQIFSATGGRRLAGLGQWQRAFSPHVLGGLGQAACTDDLGQPVNCSDPMCLGGPCAAIPGTTPIPTEPPPSPLPPAPVPANLCSPGYAYNPNTMSCDAPPTPGICGDVGGEWIACNDPGCRTGPCTAPGTPPGTSPVSRPSPVVNVGTNLFPATSPVSSTRLPSGCASGYTYDPATMTCKPGTIVSGIPNLAIYALAAVAFIALATGGRR